MKSLVKRGLALALCLLVLTGQALAVTASEQFRRVTAVINARGLIAETEPITEDEIEDGADYLETHPEALSRVLNDILSRMDTHSMYLTAAEYNRGFSTLTGYAGVGVQVRSTARGHEVVRVTRHSPAEAGGIQPGDVLTAIDGTDVTGLSLHELAERLQGEEGTRVRITFLRDGRTKTVTLTRAVVHTESVTAAQAAPGVAYIAIEAFSSMTDAEDFREIWDSLPAQGVKAVLLDLRGNGGGLIDCAFDMLDCMLEQETAAASLRWREDRGGTETFVSVGGGLPLNQIAVLVDSGTASAAELMAGVLHEAGGATLIGETTYGKGQGQYHLQVGEDFLVLTCLEMQLPKTGCWEGKGLAPDRAVTAGRTIAAYLETASPLDPAQTVRYGEQSAQVRALTERLHALGYLASPGAVFDTTVLNALRRFQRDAGRTPMLVADPATLEALASACALSAGQGLSIDDPYYDALTLCRAAAAQPARYQVTQTGWKAA